MADPNIKSPMDIWDYLSVIIYRTGFLITTIAIFLLPWSDKIAFSSISLLLLGSAMLASSVHLYLKSFRYIIQYAAWSALILSFFGFPMLALGATLLVVGGLCFKEYFCFRVPGLNLQPIFVTLLWFSIYLDAPIYTKILSIIVGILLAVVSFKKWSMPLHFDIGDKNKYQV